MKWIRRLLAVLFVAAALVAALVVWIAEPWSEYRPMQTWTEATRNQVLADDGREGLAEIFRNWDQGPPSSVLTAASAPYEFPRAIEALDVRYELDGKSHPLSEYLDRARVQGILALHRGNVVFERYLGQTTAESRYHLWSASKSFTGTIIGMALEEGTIESLDDPVEKYAPQFERTAYGEASIRHVMMMSSGVDFFHFKGFPERNWMYLRVFRLQEDLDAFAAELGRRVPAGTDFNYLATDTHVLSAVLRGAYGKPYHEIVQEKLWDALGIGGDALWSQNVPGPEGVAFGHCCLAARLLDFAHLGEFHLRGGVWGGRRLVPEGWVEMVGAPNAAFQEPSDDSSGYGMQFWVPLGYEGEFYGAGAFGQYLWIDTRREVVVAQFAAQMPGDISDRERNAALRAIVAAISPP
ncbi:MAG: beta-lactamase family protein [Myxococcota bacterium]|nr:beta-lactamase family protein [Myxococcota bacterium]